MKKTILFSLLAFSLTYANAQWQVTSGPSQTAVALLISGDSVFAGVRSNSAWSGIFRSSDNGSNWVSANGDGINYDVEALIKKDEFIFATQGHQIYVTENNGANWTNVSTGLSTYSVNAFAVSGETIYAGARGVYATTDNGLTWINLTPDWVTTVTSLAIQDGAIYAGTMSNGVQLSIDNGTTWNAVNTNLDQYAIYALAVYESSVFAGTNYGVFSSTNMGSSWTLTGLTQPIRSFTIADSYIFAGSPFAGVFLSFDSGTTWQSINEGLEVNEVAALAANDSYLFAGVLGTTVHRRPLSDFINVGISDKESSTNVQLFPNPSTDKITISLNDLSQETQLSIFTISGQKIASEKYRNADSIELNVSGFQSGIYFLKVETENDSFLKKFVVQ